MTKKTESTGKENESGDVDQAMARIKVGIGYKAVDITFWSKPQKAS